MTDQEPRSRDACPVCGAHQLTVLEFPGAHEPYVPPTGAALGVSVSHEATPPGIGCLACGAEWPDLAAFQAALAGAGDPPTEADGGSEVEPDSAAEPEAGATD